MRDTLYLIDNQVKLDIESCIYDSSHNVYHVRFAGKNTIYHYNTQRLLIYKYKTTYLPPFVSVKYKDSGAYMNGVKQVYEYTYSRFFSQKKCWCINDQYYYTDESILVDNACPTPQSISAFFYIKELSKYGLKSDDGHELLAHYFNRIEHIDPNSLLEHYLVADKHYNPKIHPITPVAIFPFG